jgi:hypothetical protein
MNLALQDGIFKAQDLMLQMPQVECEVFHHFSDGLYARELHIPEGVVLVGALHKTRHMFFVQKGQCTVITHEGEETITAPYMGETVPGIKRIIRADTDCVWIGFHVTDKTEPDEIGKDILEDWVCG